MNDERLRGLKHCWDESQSTEDEAAYLAGRVRFGELSPVRLDLAAFLDHAAARLAAPTTPAKASPLLAGWVRDLTSWGVQPPLRAGLLVARMLLAAQIDPPLPAAFRAQQEDACQRVSDWLECPCEEHLKHAIQLDSGWDSPPLIKVLATIERVGPERIDVSVQEAARHGSDLVGRTLQRLSENAVAAALGPAPALPDDVHSYPPVATDPATPAQLAARAAYDQRAAGVGARVAAQMRRAITKDLLAWALG
ncbi:MAG: hypothetical protein JKY65_02525 [Planctomycetes bacterium]|nr:hypothetical protein [Planctomycetota bacterium]